MSPYNARSQRHFSQEPLESEEKDLLAEDTVLLADLEEENVESSPIPTWVLPTSTQDIDLQSLLLALARQANPLPKKDIAT